MAKWADPALDSEEQLRRKKKAIIREAAKVFSRKGFHGTTLDEVADRLNVTKTALYRYVKNKNELLAACHEEAMEIAFDALAAGEKQGSNGLEKIRIAMTIYLREMIGAMGVPVLILEENALTGEEAVKIIGLRDRFEKRVREMFLEGVKDGSVVQVNPKLATFMLLGAVHWVTKWYSPEGAWTPEDVSEALMEMATRGFAADPSNELKAGIHHNLIEFKKGRSET